MSRKVTIVNTSTLMNEHVVVRSKDSYGNRDNDILAPGDILVLEPGTNAGDEAEIGLFFVTSTSNEGSEIVRPEVTVETNTI